MKNRKSKKQDKDSREVNRCTLIFRSIAKMYPEHVVVDSDGNRYLDMKSLMGF